MKSDDTKKKTLGVVLGVRLSEDELTRVDDLLGRFDGPLSLSRSQLVRLALTLGLAAIEDMKTEDLGRALLTSSGPRGRGRAKS